jgi:glycosyltransferase involved in cell wall biosynthesis
VAQNILRGVSIPEVLREDVLAADLDAPFDPPVPPVREGEALVLSWVMTPPSRGSGGHTTLFRLIEHLERRGHDCRVFLYDVYGSDAAYHEAVLRDAFPQFRGPVLDMTERPDDAHALFATSWQTAYPVYRSRGAGKRFYLVQDFEPAFYAASTQSALAEATYRMGFHAVTAGRWLATKLAGDYGMAADGFDFGCDTDRYQLGVGPRDGIVFYARPDAPRRAFDLGTLALELFAAARPDVTIHLYGGALGRLPFPAVQHGHVGVDELNEIYGRCFAGLTLSLTNVSLVPFEMMAAGCIPVVNDAEHNRTVLDNDFVWYADASPHALAAALQAICSLPDFAARSASAAGSMHSVSWDDAGATVERVLYRELVRQPAPGVSA